MYIPGEDLSWGEDCATTNMLVRQVANPEERELPKED